MQQRRNMIVVLITGAVLVMLNWTLISPALPTIMVDFNIDATTAQWLTSAYSLTEAVVIPLAAWFMGRFKTRVLFIGGLGLFATGSLLAAVAPAFPLLLLARVMQAMAAGVLMVMVTSLTLLLFPREKRGLAMGIVNLAMGFSPAIGPTIGGILIDAVGWHILFAIVFVCALLVMALAANVLVDQEGFSHTSADPLSIVFSSLGLVSLLYGLSTITSSSNTVLCAVLIAIGVVLLLVFVRRQLHLEEPMLRLEVLKSRPYRVSVLAIAVLQAILIGLTVLLPLYIQNVLGYSATISGLITLPGGLAGVCAALMAGRIFDRSGVRKVAIVGGVIGTLAFLLMANFQIDSTAITVAFAYMVGGLGIQLLLTPLNTWGVNSLDNDLVQHATAVTNTMNQVGGSIGTALIMTFSALGSSTASGTATRQLFAGYHLSFCVVLALALADFVLVLVCVRDKKTDPNPRIGVASPHPNGKSLENRPGRIAP